jgi:hypothetical protein
MHSPFRWSSRPRVAWTCALIALTPLGSAATGAAPTEPTSSPAPGIVWTYDARPLRHLNLGDPANAAKVWDTLHLVAALQGLVNRESPSLYLFYCEEFGVDTDQFWFDWARTEDGWLRDADVRTVPSLEALVRQFREQFDGLAVYDPKVPATSNAASTAAGCDHLLPVRYDPAPDSIYRLLAEQLGLPVRLWLVNPDGTSRFTGTGNLLELEIPSSGSPKVDVYRWALERYLKSGRCAPGVAAYYLDAYWLERPRNAGSDMHTLSNHDFFIARRGFFFDLSSWADEPPVDDPRQPVGLDHQTLLEVLRALYDHAGGGMTRLGGFTPWPHKYTSHAGAGKHEPVPTEWEFSRIVSQFNAYVEADAAGLGAIANASFFQHYPLEPHYPQPNARPTAADWRAREYVTDAGKVAPRFYVGHYVGDYDSPSWLYKAVPPFFRDPKLGHVPLGWAFNPNLAERAPQALVYARRHATTNDFFIAGNSGAGYVNVRALTVRPDSGLASGLEAWRRHCLPYYRRWDLSVTGFVLDGSAGAATETEFALFRDFSPHGLGTHFERRPALRAGIPTCPEVDLPDRVDAAVAAIADRARQRGDRPGFLWARSILKSPSWYAEISAKLREHHGELGIEIVDPYTFFGLIAEELRP